MKQAEGATKLRDIYTRVTEAICADLEAGVRPWFKPWSTPGAVAIRPLRWNGAPYRGINVIMLWAAAADEGYACSQWLTFKQAAMLGGNVRKGEKGQAVVYASTSERVDPGENGEAAETRRFWFLKSYTVFSAEQCDGLPEEYYSKPEPTPAPQRIEHLEKWLAATGAVIKHQDDRASYQPKVDVIWVPPIASFKSPEAYYATICHELVHWTGHSLRLNRHTDPRNMDEVLFEELIAELGAAFLAADHGIWPAVREENAAYIGGWLRQMHKDSRLIFKAAADAQKAVDYLRDLQPQSAGDEALHRTAEQFSEEAA
jgi:antirestriction protein ArdC